MRSLKSIPTILFIQSVSNFHSLHTILREDLDNVPRLPFHDKSHFLEQPGSFQRGLARFGLNDTEKVCDYALFIELPDLGHGPSVKESSVMTYSPSSLTSGAPILMKSVLCDSTVQLTRSQAPEGQHSSRISRSHSPSPNLIR
jgi:hypothetical protein